MSRLSERSSRAAEAATDAIEAAEWLDDPAFRLANAVSTGLQLGGRAAQPAQDALHGTWLGHPLHPVLATLPIGTWTLAFGLDAAEALGVAGEDGGAARAADLALGAGAAGAVAAAASGLVDWRQIHGRDRRTGLVHAALNSTALGLTLGSLALRRRGRRGAGRALSGAGWLALMAGAYLGGHLVYRRRVGVDHADRSPEPRGFQPVIALGELPEDRPVRVEVWDEAARAAVGVALVRHRGRVHAMGSRCSHFGGPLDEGWVQEGGLVCPWHGSRYCLATGRALNGPSTAPQPLYETRVRDGVVEIRHVPEPGDEALTPEEIAANAPPDALAAAPPDEREADRDARVLEPPSASSPREAHASVAPLGQEMHPAAPLAHEPHPGAPLARKADEVLFEHHQLLRRLFEAIEAMDGADPERRDLMRTLASELEIHEHVEDAIFYPAVRPVSEDVPVAHAEHQQLADMLALALRLGTGTPAFEAQLRALHQAVDHHASSEERSMFREAQRLGDARLRELGARIEAMLDEERASRARRAYRALKIRLLEGVSA